MDVRYLIRQAHGGETRVISDGAWPYFQNQGYVIVETLGAPPAYALPALPVVHGDDANALRPPTVQPVVWYGSVAPVHLDAGKGDEWVTSGVDMAALRAALGAGRALRNSAVVLGDSNTAAPRGTDVSDGQTGAQVPAWFVQLCVQSRQRIQYAGLYAKSGSTVEQVRDAKLAQVVALNPAPGACFINLGTNNISADSGGGAGSGFNLATASAAYEDILGELKGRGILPVIVLPIPNGSVGTNVVLNQQKWNQRLQVLAAAHQVPLLDFYSPVLDVTTGGIAAAYAADALHINAPGRRAVATAALAQGIAEFFPPAPLLTAKATTDTTNDIPGTQALYTNTASWWGYGDNGNTTVATVAPQASDRLAGNWHQLTHVGASTTVRETSNTITLAQPYTTGDLISFTARCQTTGVEAALAAGQTASVVIRAVLKNSNGDTIGYVSGTEGAPQFDVDIPDGTVRGVVAAPAGVAQIAVQVLIGGASAAKPIVVRVGELTLRDLTRLTA